MDNASLERLAILSEELGEAQQIIGKIIRHGYLSYNPMDSSKVTNKILLTKELGDVLHAVLLLDKYDEIVFSDVEQYCTEKAKKILPYLHHTKGLI